VAYADGKTLGVEVDLAPYGQHYADANALGICLTRFFFFAYFSCSFDSTKIHKIVSNHTNSSNIHRIVSISQNQVQVEYQMIKYAHSSVKSSSSNTHRIRYLKYIAHVYLEAESPTTPETGSR
jgi:hypothetical protein